MSTKKTFLLIFIAILLTFGIIIRNAFFNGSRILNIIKVKGQDVCYLASSNLTIEKVKDGFSYKSLNYARVNSKKEKRNIGIVRLVKADFTPGYSVTNVTNFEARNFKEKNYRYFEYQIEKGLILKEVFEYTNQYSNNLIPYRGICEKLLKKHKLVLEI